MKRVLFTGGGTAGHVTPNVALIERLRAEGWEAAYVGSSEGIEREIVGRLDITFHGIQTGKLRRYFDWQNFIDPFRIFWGFLQSLLICLRFRPNVVFSKGGFVAVPVVAAAWCCRVPVIAHESDMTPGLANKLCFPFSRRICVNFQETEAYLPAGKVVVSGSPVRRAIREGDAQAGRQALGLGDKPVLLVFGGSLGAATINRVLREIVPSLCETFTVVHAAGPGNLDSSLESLPGYVQREYIGDEFGDVLAAADIVVSRAGANSVYELLATRTPHILVPLPLSASRGDQIENARVFEGLGMSHVIAQEDLTGESLQAEIERVWADREAIAKRIQAFEIKDSVEIITDLIKSMATR